MHSSCEPKVRKFLAIVLFVDKDKRVKKWLSSEGR
jgi:hypothetical protein